jgi:hypothetical protein
MTYRPISRLLLVLMLCLLLPLSLHAQDDGGASPFGTPDAPTPYGVEVITYEVTTVYAGPGATYAQVGLLPGGAVVRIRERSYTGHWLHIVAPDGVQDDDGTTDDLTGWILTGYVDMAGINLSTLPVNDLPDADPDADAPGELRDALYAVPVVPRTISEAMREVYAAGQAQGNRDNVVVKVGDSNSANRLYLNPIGEGNYELGPYDFLADTVAHFAGSLDRRSVAAQVGLNAFSVFDPFWANSTSCQPNETPLACEYRTQRPFAAVILFGPNDLRVLNSDDYEAQMRRIIEETIAAGVIPVLSTFSANPDAAMYGQALRFNVILTDLAAEYGAPVVNLWLAAGFLPNRGIGDDDVHLTAAGEAVEFSGGREARFGVPLQNLIVLHTLDVLRRELVG